ncbi:unnamed protein product [Ambrosiozyma monospora]|uniref:Unnamed protein product n=1 Tax=Ambrosiozyma monospora TaxID=43982 RepID=A0A9W6YUN3_AMBMO|nr:unnamed protein product [Ambrosiozyma monospora]
MAPNQKYYVVVNGTKGDIFLTKKSYQACVKRSPEAASHAVFSSLQTAQSYLSFYGITGSNIIIHENGKGKGPKLQTLDTSIDDISNMSSGNDNTQNNNNSTSTKTGNDLNDTVNDNESIYTYQKSLGGTPLNNGFSEIKTSVLSTASCTTAVSDSPLVPKSYVMKHIYINVVYQHLPKPKVGYGVYFGEDDPRKVSDTLPVESNDIISIQRNAELMALKEALRQILLGIPSPSFLDSLSSEVTSSTTTPTALDGITSIRQNKTTNNNCPRKYCIITNSTDLKSLINKWTLHWLHDELNSFDNFKTTLMNTCMLHQLVNKYYGSLQLGPLMVYHVDDVSFDVTKGLRQAWFLANSACVTESNADVVKPIKFEESEYGVSSGDAACCNDDEHTLFQLCHDDNVDKACSNVTGNDVDQKEALSNQLSTNSNSCSLDDVVTKHEFYSMVTTLQCSVIQLQQRLTEHNSANIGSSKPVTYNTTNSSNSSNISNSSSSSASSTTTIQHNVLESQVQTRASHSSIRAFRTLLRLSWSLFKICAILYFILDIYVCYFYNFEEEIGLGLNYDSYSYDSYGGFNGGTGEQGNVNGQSSKEFKKMQKRKMKTLKKLKRIRDKNRMKQKGKHGNWTKEFNFRDANGGVIGLVLCFIYFVIYVFDL